MSTTSSSHRERFLHAVASLYYNEGKTQVEIAELLDVSRSKILRALQEARSVGIVQITIVDPSATNEELANELEQTLGLAKAVVTAAHPTDSGFTRRRVGHAAANHLKEVLPEGGTLGIGWGRTLFDVTQTLEFDRRYETQVIPLLGGLGKIAPSFQVHDTARVAADAVINKVIVEAGGDGGAIALAADGTVAFPFNTEGMYRGWIGADGVPHVAIFADEKLKMPGE